jgi:hypothetical protein
MRTKPFTPARARAVVLILAGITAGSLLSGPAVAHTGKKIAHLTKHLDALYLNENQKAADANQLDGLDSTAFLRSNGKAADADLLDGISSAGFLLAGGKAVDSNLLDNLDSTAFLQGASLYTRHFSCAGTAFTPATDEAWNIDGSGIYPDDGVNEIFRCSVDIPDGGIVTRVDVSVLDNDATDDVSDCEMWRTDMAATIGNEDQMADTGGTTGAAAAGQRLSDTTITTATIDNASFSYFVQCNLEQTGTDALVLLYGTNLTYTITGTAGGG